MKGDGQDCHIFNICSWLKNGFRMLTFRPLMYWLALTWELQVSATMVKVYGCTYCEMFWIAYVES